MQSPSQEFRVGFFTLVGLGLLCGLVLLYGEEPTWFWTTRWRLEILVNTPRGIGEGTPTFLQGVKVGRVSHIELKNPTLPNLGASVLVEIDEQFDIPQGTHAMLHPSFGFDKGAIHLIPLIEPRDPLPRESASIRGETVGPLDAVVPQEFVENLVQAVEQISKVGSVADQLVTLLEPRDKDLVDAPDSDLMANLSTLIQRVDESMKLFNQLVGDGEQAEIRRLIANLREVSGNLADFTARLDQHTESLVTSADRTLASVEAHVADVAGRMGVATDRVASLADQLHAIAATVNTGEGTLGRMISDPKLYEALVDAVAELKLAIEDVRALMTWVQAESVLRFGL